MKKEKEVNWFRDEQAKMYKQNPSKQELGKKLKCFIYARVSDPKQITDGSGIETQTISCEHFAKEKEIMVDHIFQDKGISGRLSSRKEFDLMIEKIKEKNKHGINIDYVLMSEYSRFSRNEKIGVSEQMEDEIKALGCNIMFVKGGLSTGNKNDSYQLDLEKIKAKYESVENSDRTISRMTGKLLSGQYVFPVPVGYEYEKISIGHKKTQSFVRKVTEQAEILKEGLEGYANRVFQSPTQLLNFFNKRNLKSNHHSPNIGNLQLSFITNLLKRDKLYFYAGYIVYPRFGIFEPIKANHEAIIGYDTLYKITQIQEGKGNKKHGVRNDSSAIYPLRGMIFCPTCNSPISASPSKGNGGIYHYYLCNRKPCSLKFSVPIDKVHQDFLGLLGSMKPREEIEKLLDRVFDASVEKSKGNQDNRSKSIRQEIDRIEREMNKRIDTIGKLTNSNMINRMEEERAVLNQKKLDLEEQTENKLLSEIEIKDLYMRYKTIVTNPVAIWEMGNNELKMMLISVLFGGKLYYSKKLGFQTNENQAILRDSPLYLYNLLSSGAVDEIRTRDILRHRQAL